MSLCRLQTVAFKSKVNYKGVGLNCCIFTYTLAYLFNGNRQSCDSILSISLLSGTLFNL